MEQIETIETVQMTAEELAEYKAFQASIAQKKAKKQRQKQLDDYNQLIDEEVSSSIEQLLELSNSMSDIKRQVFDNFRTLLQMKDEVLKKTKDGQRSHTFTSSDGKARIILGYHTIDNYNDTAQDGIALIKEYISSLAKDDESKALAEMVLQLLAKDQKGTLKASRVLQLNNMKNKINNGLFSEGVDIIMNAYAPVVSKQFIQASIKGEDGEWNDIPLSITNA